MIDILLDMDGTIVDLMGNLEKKSQLDHTICQWDVAHCFKEGKSVYQHFNHQGMFLDAEPIESALDAVYNLIKDFDVWVLTTPPMYSEHGHFEKTLWIDRHLPQLTDKIIFSQYKHIVPAKVLVDDKPGLEGPWHHVMYPQTWNTSSLPTWAGGLEQHIRECLK